jgi:Uma2 family endonuclease
MSRSLPPFANGDVLTRADFERRSRTQPGRMKVELLDGEVHVTEAPRRTHSAAHGIFATWLGDYSAATPGTEFDLSPTLRLDETSQPEPDAVLCVTPEAGGLASEDAEGYFNGPVELVAEVAASSAAIDLHKKKKIYLRNAIPEYVVYAVHEAQVFWFALEGGAYVAIEPDGRGIARSRVFPGLWLDMAALARGDGARVLSVLQRGLATKAHALFARELAKRLRRRRPANGH